MHYEPVSGPGAWYGRDLARRDDWIHVFSAAQIREIEAAVAGARVPLGELTPKAFPLPSVGPFLRRVLSELLEGRGFVLLRGLPMERWSREQQAIAYLGIGSGLAASARRTRRAPARPCEGPRARHPRSERALLPDQSRARVPHRLGRHRRPSLPADRESGRRELPGELDDGVQRSPAPPARRRRRALRAIPDRPPRRGARRHEAVVRHSDLPPARRPALVHLRAPVHRVGAEEVPAGGGLRARRSRRWI